MQRKQAKPFIITGLLVAAGLSGGMLLANFTTGGTTRDTPTLASTWTATDPASTEAPILASASPMDGPRSYVCHGCGPTLAEQREKADAARYARADYGYGELAPMPSYHPAAEGEEDGMVQASPSY